jgi:mono/diheme cytochrome c family protein
VRASAGVGLVLLLALATVRAHDPITTRVTWNADIGRIVAARCVTCHTRDGRGPMSLATYEDARPWAKAIKEEVMTRRMPKWHAVRGYGDFSNDPSLSAFEIALVAAWADGGAPKGLDPPAAAARQENGSPDRVEHDPRGDTSLRKLALPCGEEPMPASVLVAVQPDLEKGQSVGIAVRMPDGRRDMIAWIRNYDPDFPTTYWLRTPLVLPAGAVLQTEPKGGCAVIVTLKARR